MRVQYITAAILFLFAASQVKSQTATEGDTLYNNSFQYSLFPGLSTNGLQAPKYTNEFSLNFFAGENGGVEGFEMGFVNIINYNVRGAQLGLTNIVKGDLTGAQIAALINVAGTQSSSIQLAGLVNVNIDSSSMGSQLAGLVNVYTGDLTGLQGAGIYNQAGEVKGIQASGLVNHGGKLHGAQFAGLVNHSLEDANGAQFAGLVNQNGGHMNGGQFATLFNHSESIFGTQMALVNHTNHLTGSQIGLINVADSAKNGVPIGFMSFVKNGYKSVDLGANEVLYGQLGFRTGVNAFYNIIVAGSNFMPDDYIWSFGYGIGSRVPWGKNNAVELEVIAYHMNEGSNFTNELNLLSRFNSNISIGLGERLSIYMGPSFNFYITEVYDFENGQIGTDFGFEAIDEGKFEDTVDDYYWKYWVGANFGIKF